MHIPFKYFTHTYKFYYKKLLLYINRNRIVSWIFKICVSYNKSNITLAHHSLCFDFWECMLSFNAKNKKLYQHAFHWWYYLVGEFYLTFIILVKVIIIYREMWLILFDNDKLYLAATFHLCSSYILVSFLCLIITHDQCIIIIIISFSLISNQLIHIIHWSHLLCLFLICFSISEKKLKVCFYIWWKEISLILGPSRH